MVLALRLGEGVHDLFLRLRNATRAERGLNTLVATFEALGIEPLMDPNVWFI